jgi:uncharacterized protein (TIGR00255 family)
MLRSMTGYAAASATANGATVTVTLKSVNHRFLDLHLRLPAEVDSLEPKLRQTLRARLARGHVDLVVMVDRPGAVEVRFDRALVRGYFEAFAKLREEMHVTAEADLNGLLKLPGAVTVMPAATPGDAQIEELDCLLFQALGQALDGLDKMRCHEGEVLCQELLNRSAALDTLADRIEGLREGADRRIFDRLKQRITELAGQSAAPERIAQEAAILAERGDVSEEIQRLKSHVGQFRDTLKTPPDGGETGKRFDFLLQEMNREANTILSKTAGDGAGLEITDLAIQAKAEIEKLREQVQNLQ